MSNVCSDCGGTLIGDGYSTVVHCEEAQEELYSESEPDANPVMCGFNAKPTNAKAFDAVVLMEQRVWDGLSLRGAEWVVFASEVLAHIEEYTVPQYGDAGVDAASDYTAADFVRQIQKYAARHGRNARVGQDRLDALKVAHYAQMLANKLN